MFSHYHAHVYFDEISREFAEEIRTKVSKEFVVELGRWREEPVGPHPQSMYQIRFAQDQFGRLVPWLMANHQDLSILIHPEGKDDLQDHTEHALWLGDSLTLRLEVFDEH